MAAVGQSFQSADPQVDRDRERDSAAARFTTVNGKPNSASSPRTSFRPDGAAPSEPYCQHPLPGQAAPPEQTHQPPHRLNAEERTAGQSAVLSPASEYRRQNYLGKRKRSLGSPHRTSPVSLSSLVRPSSPAALNPIAGRESPSRNLPPLLSYAHPEHAQSRDQTRRQQQSYVEAQPADLPQRDSHMYPVRRDRFEGNDEGQLQAGPRSDSSVRKQTEPRKRKFSQRTKNGCHTCRSRKKKCDEGTPFCQNCIRGNFPCQGYGPKNELNVKLQSKSMPLQSKSSASYAPGYYQSSAPGAPTEQWLEGQSRYPPESQYRGRPFDDNPRYGQRDEPKTMEHAEYERPYLQEGFGRTSVPEATRAPPPSRFSMMALSGPHTDNGASSRGGSISGMFTDTRTGQFAPRPANLPQRIVDTTEKENMLAGRLYRHFLDPHLMDERTWCQEALERFNNAARALSGIDRSARAKLFSEVVMPQRLVDAADARFPVGSIGSQSLVEAPFQCLYGYNINIGEEVVIQAGCIMYDPCKITIGKGTVVGPNVRFYGLGIDLDPRVRNGCHGRSRGGPITIEDECFIGGDALILPNVVVGRGAVVGAGTVVSKNVPPNTVVAGKPMRIIRDIGPSPNEEFPSHFQADSSAGGLWSDRFGNRLLGS